MQVIEILRQVSKQVYDNVKNLSGTEDAAGDFGRGAGGDISRKIDIIAEKTVLDYLKQINFNCVVLGEECGRVEISPPAPLPKSPAASSVPDRFFTLS